MSSDSAGNPNPVAGDGTTPPSDWRAQLPDDLKAEKALSTFKGKDAAEVLPVLAKSLVESQKMISSSIRMPKPDAKPEEITAFYQKLGLPASVEEYKVQIPQGLAEAGFSEDLAKAFVGEAHKNGILPKHAQAVMDFYGKAILEGQAQAIAHVKEQAETVKKDWGPHYERRVGLAKAIIKQFGGPITVEKDAEGKEISRYHEIENQLGPGGIEANPAMLKLLARIGEAMRPSGIIDGDASIEAAPKDAQSKIDAVLADKKGPYWNAEHPDHKKAVTDMMNLYKIVHPEKA